MTQGIILYGPPASGKDAITQALHDMDERYVLFPRLKVGIGRTAGYRMISNAVLDQLRAAGQLIWENDRYGSTYAIDREEIVKCLSSYVPVLHVGQGGAIAAVKASVPGASWLVAALECPRDVTHQRLLARGTFDVEDRLTAWDETPPLVSAELRINTARTSLPEAASIIHGHISTCTDGRPRP